MNSVLILSKKCATGEVLFSFGRKKFEKFDFRTGLKRVPTIAISQGEFWYFAKVVSQRRWLQREPQLYID